MHRRDTRDVLFSVRAKQGAEEKAAAAAASGASGGMKRAATAETGAGEGGGAAAAVPSAAPMPVERRLVELDCNEIFQLCMMYV